MGAVFRTPRLRDPRVVPTEDVEIDWSHPLAAGLVHLIVPGGARFLEDLSDTLAPMALLGGSIWPSNLGPQIHVVSGSHGADVFVGTALPITTQGTFYTRGEFVAASYAGTQLYGVQDSTGYNYSFGWGTNTTQGSAYVNIGGTSYGGSAVSFSPNTPFSYGGTFASGGSLTQYVSGQAAGSAAIGAGNLSLGANTYIVLNTVLYNSAVYIEATQALCALWRRALSADEMAWLDAEPFAMLRPKMRRRYYVVPSSGTTLTPAAGTLAFVGATPTVEIGVSVAPAAGTLAIDGQTPVAEIGVEVSPGHGTLSLDGGTPVAEIGVTVAPGHGALALTGEVPTVSTGDTSLTVSPDHGTLSITGETPVAEIGVTVAPAHGTLTLAGQPPAAEVGVTVAPGSGTLELAGVAPTVDVGIEVAPGAGLLSLDGQTPVVIRGDVISPASGTIGIAGATPVIVIGGLMIPTEIVVFAAPVDEVAFAAALDRVTFASPVDEVVF